VMVTTLGFAVRDAAAGFHITPASRSS
jgi:hypothetical protein